MASEHRHLRTAAVRIKDTILAEHTYRLKLNIVLNSFLTHYKYI